MIEPGDKVRFVGNPDRYITRYQRVLASRIGEVYRQAGGDPSRVYVRWIPRTKRGTPEYGNHHPEELEVVKG